MGIDSAGRVSNGDFDGSGKLDIADIDLLTAQVVSGTHSAGFDLDGDSVVDDADRRIWIENIKHTYFGDANLDGEFNSGDLVAVFDAGQYEDGIAANSNWATGDWNGDGDFTTSDLVLAFQDGGYEQGPRQAIAVPEPNSIIVLGIALICFIDRRQRLTVASIRRD
jgi:hypothetical protein